jgi:hypothetical protein
MENIGTPYTASGMDMALDSTAPPDVFVFTVSNR